MLGRAPSLWCSLRVGEHMRLWVEKHCKPDCELLVPLGNLLAFRCLTPLAWFATGGCSCVRAKPCCCHSPWPKAHHVSAEGREFYLRCMFRNWHVCGVWGRGRGGGRTSMGVKPMSQWVGATYSHGTVAECCCPTCQAQIMGRWPVACWNSTLLAGLLSLPVCPLVHNGYTHLVCHSLQQHLSVEG